jgi:hypothetical protein
MNIILQDPSEWNLRDMLWSGAEKTLEEIIDADKYDEFCAYIEDTYTDGIDLTELNDLLRFDFDSIRNYLGMQDWGAFKDLISSKAIKKAQDAISEIEEKWEEFKDSDENKDEKGNTIYDDIDEWVEDNYSSEPYSLVRSAVDMIEGEVERIAEDGEKSDDWDSMVEAITQCGIEDDFDDFSDIVEMANDLDMWLVDNL